MVGQPGGQPPVGHGEGLEGAGAEVCAVEEGGHLQTGGGGWPVWEKEVRSKQRCVVIWRDRFGLEIFGTLSKPAFLDKG